MRVFGGVCMTIHNHQLRTTYAHCTYASLASWLGERDSDLQHCIIACAPRGEQRMLRPHSVRAHTAVNAALLRVLEGGREKRQEEVQLGRVGQEEVKGGREGEGGREGGREEKRDGDGDGDRDRDRERESSLGWVEGAREAPTLRPLHMFCLCLCPCRFARK